MQNALNPTYFRRVNSAQSLNAALFICIKVINRSKTDLLNNFGWPFIKKNLFRFGVHYYLYNISLFIASNFRLSL